VKKLLLTFLFFTLSASAGVICKPSVDRNCSPLYEWVPLAGANGTRTYALPVVTAYVRNISKEVADEIRNKNFPNLGAVENYLDEQFLYRFAEFTLDDDFMNYVRETGQEFNWINVNFQFRFRNRSDVRTFIYKALILPSSSMIVFKRSVAGRYSSSAPISRPLPDEVRLKSDVNPVILRTGANFWKDYMEYRDKGGILNPLEFYRWRWKKLPGRIKNVETPPVFFVKGNKLFVIRGKVSYFPVPVEVTYTEKVKEGPVTLKDLLNQYGEERARNGVTNTAADLLWKIGKLLFSRFPDTEVLLAPDAGLGVLAEADGVHVYRILYAATPMVYRWQAENDPRYYEFGMNDPTAIYWGDPFRNSVVVPERVACLYWAGFDCRRFKKYVPASKHPARLVALRAVYRFWREKLKERGLNYMRDNDSRHRIIAAMESALFSQKLELPDGVTDELMKEAFLEVAQQVNSLRRLDSEETFLPTCNSDGLAESVFVVPKQFEVYTKALGLQTLRSNDAEAAIFDPNRRLVYSVNCTQVTQAYEKAASSFRSGILNFPPNPVLQLNAPQSSPTTDGHVLGTSGSADIPGGGFGGY